MISAATRYVGSKRLIQATASIEKLPCPFSAWLQFQRLYNRSDRKDLEANGSIEKLPWPWKQSVDKLQKLSSQRLLSGSITCIINKDGRE